MSLLLELQEKARRAKLRIVLPEAHDPRVRQAATSLAQVACACLCCSIAATWAQRPRESK